MYHNHSQLSVKYLLVSIPNFSGYFADVDGNIYSTKRGSMKKLSPRLHKNGYLVVLLTVNGKHSTQYVHRLVALAFHGEPTDPKMIVCHGPDHTKTNCEADNLRWDTRSKNAQDAIANGAKFSGKRKLNADKVRAIRSEQAAGASNTSLASRYGVSLTLIGRIVSRNAWKNVV